mmetsp:Transcript_9862/g.34372  ORF Transcript_9862/g.34372 Transcript_9862/m.34372 type:complete len:150 (+) Transcript_9862:16-465(+)
MRAFTRAAPAPAAALRRLLRAHCAPPAPELSVGARFERKLRFRQEDVDAFCTLTGDANPLHAPSEGSAVVPGSLTAAAFPGIIGTEVPGAVYATQTLAFRRPVLVGEAVVAAVEVTRLSGRRAVFRTTVSCPGGGQVAVDGDALAVLPR